MRRAFLLKKQNCALDGVLPSPWPYCADEACAMNAEEQHDFRSPKKTSAFQPFVLTAKIEMNCVWLA